MEDKTPAPKAPQHIYSTVELAGDRRLILKLDDGRMFGVALPKPLSPAEPLPARAQLKVDHVDEAGVPQGATFQKFVTE